STEGRAEFAAQFKLLGQAVTSAIALADTPQKCDEQLSRLMVQLEELEGRFSELDEFLADLAQKRDEVYEAFENKKQQLLDDRNRRAQNLARAADRILEGVERRVRAFASADDLNAYFASDPMIMKLRGLVEQLRTLGDSVKADDLVSRQKSAKQNALRNLRDKLDLFEGGGDLIKFGHHRFTVNTQNFELTMVPRDEGMALHLTGTDFYESIDDEAFGATRPYWDQHIVSETPEVYRGEYLAACMLFDAERGESGLSIPSLVEASHDHEAMVERVRSYAASRYDEGYERGLHDADTAKILTELLRLVQGAGRLRYAPNARAWAVLYWAFGADEAQKNGFHRRAQSLARLRMSFAHPAAEVELANELSAAIATFGDEAGLSFPSSERTMAGRYLVEELGHEHPRFVTSQEAQRLRTAFGSFLEVKASRADFERDLMALQGDLRAQLSLARAWTEAFMAQGSDELEVVRPSLLETAVLLLTETQLDHQETAVVTQSKVE
ncbi:MAG: DNA repair protein, partial [Myxococcota bacterium]